MVLGRQWLTQTVRDVKSSSVNRSLATATLDSTGQLTLNTDRQDHSENF